MAVVDLDSRSLTYGQIVCRVEMSGAGDELHHFGWNACSSCLCPNMPLPHVERRYLIVPGLRSSRIHVIDTKPDPRTLPSSGSSNLRKSPIAPDTRQPFEYPSAVRAVDAPVRLGAAGRRRTSAATDTRSHSRMDRAASTSLVPKSELVTAVDRLTPQRITRFRRTIRRVLLIANHALLTGVLRLWTLILALRQYMQRVYNFTAAGIGISRTGRLSRGPPGSTHR
jgi:hypothetical protein